MPAESHGERGVEAELTDTYARVANSFYQTLRQSDLLELELAILEGKRLDLESTRRLFELAIGTRVDVLAAELEVQQQERAVREAENEHDKALLGLRAEIAVPDLGEFTTLGTPPEPFDPVALDEVALISRALERSPRLQQTRAEVDVGRASLSAVRSTRWPTLSLSTAFYQSGYGQEYAAAFKPFSNDSRYASARLESVPARLHGLFHRAQHHRGPGPAGERRRSGYARRAWRPNGTCAPASSTCVELMRATDWRNDRARSRRSA